MAEFTPITTQEEFDSAISARLARERRTVEGRYADYETLKSENNQMREQINGHATALQAEKDARAEAEKKVTELEGQIRASNITALKTAAAVEYGLPAAMASRLSGETKEDIEADAKELAKMVGASGRRPYPRKSTEKDDAGGDDKTAAYKTTLSNLFQ